MASPWTPVAGLTLAVFLWLLGMAPAMALAKEKGSSLSGVAAVAVRADARQEALNLLQRKNFEAAYGAYMNLLRDNPEDDEVNYGLAYAALGSGRLPQALLAFERLSDRHPADAVLHVRLAETHIRLQDVDAARRELDAARRCDASIQTDAAERALRKLKKARSLWRWSGRLGVGVIYDSNANLGPASDYMTLGQWANLYLEGVRGMESWGRYVSAGANGSRRLAEGSPWLLVGDAGFYKRWNGNPDLLSNREFGWGRAGLGMRYLSRRVMLEARVKGEEADQGQGQHIWSFGPEFTAVWAPHAQVQFISRAGWEKRDYRHDCSHSGTYWWGGQYVRFFVGEARHEIMAGARGLRGVPRREAYAYTGWEGSLSLTFRLPLRLSLSPFFSFRRDRYHGPASALESARRSDGALRYGLSVQCGLTGNLTADIAWQGGRYTSSSPLYRYTQHTLTMGLNWIF